MRLRTALLHRPWIHCAFLLGPLTGADQNSVPLSHYDFAARPERQSVLPR